MTHPEFTAQVRRHAHLIIIDLQGDIQAEAEAGLSDAWAEASRHNPQVVLLNFAGVGYINSTGIALLVGLLAQARKERRQLLVSGLSDHYMEIFQITRLADFMSVYADEQAAVAAAQS